MAEAESPPNPSMAQQLLGMPNPQKLGLMIAVAATVALLAGLWLWGQTPDYRVLYTNLSERDGGAVVAALQQQNIPYKFSEGGTLMVAADKVHEVRLNLAAQGLPRGALPGFELMENQKFGISQFLEQVNYQRALEGELARSVQTLGAVANARVHLAIPKPTVFVKEKQKPSASVVLAMNAGRTLNEEQVNAIVHLISSSVPDLPPQNVTVVDQNGTLLSVARDSAGQLLDASQLKYVRQVEQDYAQRIETILTPIVGAQNVRAQVTASLDFSVSEQTSESYKPNQPPNEAAVRSQQSSESQNGVKPVGGVPGALTNQPPVPATAPLVAPASAVTEGSTANAVNSHKEISTQYELDRTIQHTRLPSGTIRRLAVAVVLNNRSITDDAGKVASKPYSDEEKAQITALVREAVGFEEKRGDSIVLLNSAFNDSSEVLPEIPWWKQPEMIALAKDLLKYLLIGSMLFYLLFGIIKPAFRKASGQDEAAAEDGLHVTVGSEAEMEGTVAEPSSTPAAPNAFEDSLNRAKQLAKDDPKIVASVVKEWVNKDE